MALSNQQREMEIRKFMNEDPSLSYEEASLQVSELDDIGTYEVPESMAPKTPWEMRQMQQQSTPTETPKTPWEMRQAQQQAPSDTPWGRRQAQVAQEQEDNADLYADMEAPDLLRRPESAPAYDDGLGSKSLLEGAQKATQELVEAPDTLVRDAQLTVADARRIYPDYFKTMTDDQVIEELGTRDLQQLGSYFQGDKADEFTVKQSPLYGAQSPAARMEDLKKVELTEEEKSTLIRNARETYPEKYSSMTNEEILAEIEAPNKESRAGEISNIMKLLRQDKIYDLYTEDAIVKRMTDARMKGQEMSYETAEADVYSDMVQTLGDIGAGAVFSLPIGYTGAATALGRMASIGAREGVVGAGLGAYQDDREGKDVTVSSLAKDYAISAALGAAGQGAGELLGLASRTVRGAPEYTAAAKYADEVLASEEDVLKAARDLGFSEDEVLSPKKVKEVAEYANNIATERQSINTAVQEVGNAKMLEEVASDLGTKGIYEISEKQALRAASLLPEGTQARLDLETVIPNREALRIYNELGTATAESLEKMDKVDLFKLADKIKVMGDDIVTEDVQGILTDLTRTVGTKREKALQELQSREVMSQINSVLSEQFGESGKALKRLEKGGESANQISDIAGNIRYDTSNALSEVDARYSALSRLLGESKWAPDMAYLNTTPSTATKIAQGIEKNLLFGVPSNVRKQAFNKAQDNVRDKAVEVLDKRIQDLADSLKDKAFKGSGGNYKRHQLSELRNVRKAISDGKEFKYDDIARNWTDLDSETQLALNDVAVLQQYSKSFDSAKNAAAIGGTSSTVAQLATVYFLGPLGTIPSLLTPLARQWSQSGKREVAIRAQRLMNSMEGVGDEKKMAEILGKLDDLVKKTEVSAQVKSSQGKKQSKAEFKKEQKEMESAYKDQKSAISSEIKKAQDLLKMDQKELNKILGSKEMRAYGLEEALKDIGGPSIQGGIQGLEQGYEDIVGW